MTFSPINPSDHERLIATGCRQQSSRLCYRNGYAYDKRVYTQKLPCSEQAARITVCVSCCCFSLPLLSCCCIDNLLKTCCGWDNFLDNHFFNALEGQDKFECYVFNQAKSNEIYQKDYEKLGFSPNDKTSMRAYLEKNEHKVCTHLGHEFLYYETPYSKSSKLLFVPHGNRDQVTSRGCFNPVDGTSLSTAETYTLGIEMCQNYGKPGFGKSSFPNHSRAKVDLKKKSKKPVLEEPLIPVKDVQTQNSMDK